MDKSKIEEDYKGLDWEAKRNKYDILWALIIENSKDGDSEKYPNYITEVVIIKKKVSTKREKIRTNFKKVIDCGEKNGGGRTVFMFYTIL